MDLIKQLTVISKIKQNILRYFITFLIVKMHIFTDNSYWNYCGQNKTREFLYSIIISLK